jgi:hypothetical protein
MTMPPLPKPFASIPVAGSQTTSINVWASDALEAYATAAVLAEREACAKVCETLRSHPYDQARLTACKDAAAMIRARTD